MIIIFDFEVFKYNTLLGTLLVHDDTSIELKQMWSLDEIKDFYNQHRQDLWVGHNNDFYDNHILKAIIEGRTDIYTISKKLINTEIRRRADLDIITYDTMCCRFYSLKMTELLIGKKIHTSEVNFNLDRVLTDEEIKLVNEYNADDLRQTYSNFLEFKPQIMLRLDILNEFKIDKRFLTATEARLASLALHAKQIPGIEFKKIKPKIYETLQIKNKDVIDFYLSEGFRHGKKLSVNLCGVPHQLGSGGIHAALKKCHETDMLYLDVSGYYNLVMINYDLLPRTIPEGGKKLYEYMYHEQLRLKGVDNAKRSVYKTILLSVFGASMNKYTDFYDPEVGSLITITGQLFLVDLLEKLEGKVKLIQSNTDGIIVKPLQNSSEEEVLEEVDKWCKRTGFVIKPKHIKELWQRDVNCYCYIGVEEPWNCHGDAFSGSWEMEAPVRNELYSIKESAIIGTALLNYFLYSIPIEETVKKHKDNLLYFQYICKKLSYDYCSYETSDITGKVIKADQVADINRAFAKKYDGTISMIYKYKTRNGKTVRSKIPNMPDNVFIYNNEILSKDTVSKISQSIDYDYYVDRAKKRITEFIPLVKDINIYE